MSEAKEATTKNLELAYQARVREELDELSGKIERLGLFLQGPKFQQLPSIEAELLTMQHVTMRYYAFLLYERIKLFDQKAKRCSCEKCNCQTTTPDQLATTEDQG